MDDDHNQAVPRVIWSADNIILRAPNCLFIFLTPPPPPLLLLDNPAPQDVGRTTQILTQM